MSATPARLRALRRHGAEQAFDTLLAETSPALADRVRSATPVGRLHGWAGVPGFVRRPWGPGWALVGDAGYFKDPITMHGITDALRDAELLTDAILEAPGGGLTEARRWRATRKPGTDSRAACTTSPRRSRRTTGTSTRCARSCAGSARR